MRPGPATLLAWSTLAPLVTPSSTPGVTAAACEHQHFPIFAPAVFARVVLSDNKKRKSFDKGLGGVNEGSVLLLRTRERWATHPSSPPLAVSVRSTAIASAT